MKREYWYGLMFAFIVLIGVMTYDFYVTHKLIEQTKSEILEVHDTLVKYHTDTIFHEKPVYINKQIVRTDTVQLYDIKQDSVYVELPYIQKEFKDSLYEAWVSGYQDVNLDSIRVFKEKQILEINNTKYVTKYKNRPFSLGIQVGAQYNFITKHPEPYLGFGVQYNLFSFGKRK